MAQFTEEKLSDAVAVDLARRVQFVRDEEIEKIYPREFPSIVEVVMVNGKRYKVRVDMPKGSGDSPMSWAEVQDKFESLALGRLSENSITALVERVASLDDIDDVSEITSLLKGDANT